MSNATEETPEVPANLRERGEAALQALKAKHVPVASSEWKYIPSLALWQLHVDTPWMRDKGEETTRRAFEDAVMAAGITESTAFVVLRLPETEPGAAAK